MVFSSSRPSWYFHGHWPINKYKRHVAVALPKPMNKVSIFAVGPKAPTTATGISLVLGSMLPSRIIRFCDACRLHVSGAGGLADV